MCLIKRYLSRYGLEPAKVTEAFDLFQSSHRSGSTGRELQLQREATVLFRSLFSFTATASSATTATATTSGTASGTAAVTSGAVSGSESNGKSPSSSSSMVQASKTTTDKKEQSNAVEHRVERVMNAARGIAGNVLSVDDIVMNNPSYNSFYGNIYKSDKDEVTHSFLSPSLYFHFLHFLLPVCMFFLCKSQFYRSF
jgi:hypothetical protein